MNYFTDISTKQNEQLSALEDLYREWNEKINVISRKDIENFKEHHVLHSLSIAKIIDFLPNARVLDVGTGGGFPGIPLAILFPKTRFHLVDSIGKKIKVVEAVRDALGLKNVIAEQIRAEELKGQYDFVVSRAVTTLPEFYGWVRNKISPQNRHKLKNGIIYIKGGDVESELKDIKVRSQIYNISDFFKEEFFETKKIVHIWKQ
jgi:16S rRNA (guanine527-N7)-methyltransferase